MPPVGQSLTAAVGRAEHRGVLTGFGINSMCGCAGGCGVCVCGLYV